MLPWKSLSLKSRDTTVGGLTPTPLKTHMVIILNGKSLDSVVSERGNCGTVFLGDYQTDDIVWWRDTEIIMLEEKNDASINSKLQQRLPLGILTFEDCFQPPWAKIVFKCLAQVLQ